MPSASRIRRSSGVPPRRDAPAAAEVVADEDLRDAVGARVLEDRRDGILAFEGLDVRLLRARQRHVALERHPIFGGQVLLRHVDGEQLAVEAIGVAAAAGQHLGGVRARRHADEDPLLRAPGRLDAVQPQVGFELAIDDVGRQQQRALAKLRQLTCASMPASRLGRRIDDDDFVGAIDERLRHRIASSSVPRTPRTNSCCSAMYSRLIDVRTEMPASSSSSTSS